MMRIFLLHNAQLRMHPVIIVYRVL